MFLLGFCETPGKMNYRMQATERSIKNTATHIKPLCRRLRRICLLFSMDIVLPPGIWHCVSWKPGNGKLNFGTILRIAYRPPAAASPPARAVIDRQLFTLANGPGRNKLQFVPGCFHIPYIRLGRVIVEHSVPKHYENSILFIAGIDEIQQRRSDFLNVHL